MSATVDRTQRAEPGIGRLDGKVAVVTGGARGLGQAYALKLAERGADIAVADVLEAEETADAVRKLGRRVHHGKVDLVDPDGVEAFASRVAEELGGADILVNNAGVAAFRKLDELDFAEWRRVLGVNLDAGFLTAKAFVPGMKKKAWGRIIYVSSNTGWTNSPFFAHYIASKLGVVGLTRALASELGEFGITVNCIAPSIVPTPMNQATPAKDLYDDYAKMQAIHRVETPEDLALVVAFLASDDSRFITAQTIAVDGGLIRL
jgi:NAD(P)-dependent dehydrogenase (short-subunit alcohol dehydrogenase family)